MGFQKKVRILLNRMSKRISAYFDVAARGSSFLQELRGGVATFLTMSYILLVNPQILTTWIDIPDDPTGTKEDYGKGIATATAVTCGFGCILVGILTNMPFAIGPGMGLNTFVAGLLIKATTDANLSTAVDTWDQVVTTTFLSGVLLTILSAVNLVSPTIAAMPETIKQSILVGIGAYQAFIGFREMGIITSDRENLVQLEPNISFKWEDRHLVNSALSQIFFLIGLLLTTVLFSKGVKGSILIGIVLCTGLSWSMSVGGGDVPSPPVASPEFAKTWMNVNFTAWFGNQKWIPQLVVILLITIFDCGGVQFGIAKVLDLPKRYEEVDEAKREAIRKAQAANARDDHTNASLIFSGQLDDSDDDSANLEENSLLQPEKRRPSTHSLGVEVVLQHDKKRVEQGLRMLSEIEELTASSKIDLSALKEQLRNQLTAIEHHEHLIDEPFSPQSSLTAVQLLPGRSSQLTFVSLGIVNMVGALVGSSPCIVFLECAAGVKEGARTGLASVFTGICFLITLFLTPLFQKVPMCASAGPLVFIGCLMMSHVGDIKWGIVRHSLPAFLTILMMPFTSSITPGIGFGLSAYLLLAGGDKLYEVCVGPFRAPPPLHAAVAAGDISEVRSLLESGTAANDQDRDGNTPLHLAAEIADDAIINILLIFDADPLIVNNSKMTPLESLLAKSGGSISSPAASALRDAISSKTAGPSTVTGSPQ
eukprot:TRINITY_DN9424_c0_g1_i1.p1 TRINITY_DN9424_c0_g1~~TRINITY_DN9424_c0_g1_i1.p1  ORF type:complete len:708 (+),score=126.61 TRINITY_DN9424_c0_g1_i1:45-2168(+)